MEKKIINVIELFAGIGAPAKALKKLLGENVNIVDIVEFDKKAVESYNIIHNTNFKTQDIKEYSYKGNEKIDLIHASTPCQAFSVAGKGLGAADERGLILWEHTIRVIKETMPKYVTLENVKGFLQTKHKNVLDYYLNEMENLGYETKYKVVNAKNFNCAQERERVFFVSKLKDGNFWNYEIPEIAENNKNVIIKDIMDDSAEWVTEDKFTRINNLVYIENKLNNYKGRAIEIDIDKILNQDPNKINRVAKIKKIDYESNKNFFGENGKAATFAAKAYCKFQNKLLDVAFHNKSSFCGTDGKHYAACASEANFTKILDLPDETFKEDISFFGCGRHSRTLTASNCRYKCKVANLLNLETIKYRCLTTLEVSRLMTFDDADYFKLKDKISDNQLCKQFGNSIVVNVLYEIYKNML